MTDSLSPEIRKLGLTALLASKEIDRRDPDDYRRMVQRYYSGAAGWFTLVTGYFTGHESLADNVLGPGAFDVSGCQRILDAGCGNGRYLRFLLKLADPDATLVGCDLSAKMLERAQRRLKTGRPKLLTADLTRLPYADGTFDAAVCGWVLEHLPNVATGLAELARVLQPGGKLLILTTEHTIPGAICSRFYRTRTIRRNELRSACTQCGLTWKREHSWSWLHRVFRLGGIVVELEKREEASRAASAAG